MPENLCFCPFISFCSAFITTFAKITAVPSPRNPLSVVLKFFYTYNYANPLCSICRGSGLHGVQNILRNANCSAATRWKENGFSNLFYAFLAKMSGDGIVCCMTRLWFGQLRIHGSIPGCSNIFFSSQKKNS